MPAGPSSDPVLLSCAKKNGVGRQEEVAQRKPLEKVSSGFLPKQRGCVLCDEVPRPPSQPAARHFCRAKMPCGGQVFQICCSAVKSSDFLHASRYLHARKRVLPKYVEDARLGGHCKSGPPGISKGPQPFCFRKSPEKTLLKGFLWATSSRRLDTALLCAAKKRGVEIKQAGRLLPV